MNLKGQKELVEIFENMNMNQLPHSFMLLGEYGCGKHLLSHEIADKFGLDYHETTDEITSELLDTYAITNIPTLYVIDIVKVKDQNLVLKFAEESKNFVYVCLLCDNENLVLDTVLNRCIIYRFQKYDIEVLKDDVAYILMSEENQKLALTICNTIGQLREVGNSNLVELYDFCNKVVEHIGDANFPNMLSISDKFNYKDLYDKYNINSFFKFMINLYSEKYIKDNKYYKEFITTVDYFKKLNNSKYNKELLIQNYLINLWKIKRGII